jgi:hypothetical protein
MLGGIEAERQEQVMVGNRSVGRLTMMVAALALAGLAGCATNTRANLTNAADNLEYNANALVRDAGDQVARSDEVSPRSDDRVAYATDYARDAHALARDAHEFRQVVDEGGSDRAVHESFDRVSRSYHAVRDEVAHSDSPRARSDMAAITDSYRALQHELRIGPGNEQYLPPPA